MHLEFLDDVPDRICQPFRKELFTSLYRSNPADPVVRKLQIQYGDPVLPQIRRPMHLRQWDFSLHVSVETHLSSVRSEAFVHS